LIKFDLSFEFLPTAITFKSDRIFSFFLLVLVPLAVS